MALTKPTAPVFEEMNTQPETLTSQPAPAQVPMVTKPALPSVGVFRSALADKQDVLKTEDVEALGFGTFPRMTADLGGLMLDKDELGKTARIEVLSWNLRYVITPNSNDDEAKKHVKVSYDNQTISGTDESVQDYIAALKAAGYDKASSKLYVDIWANLVAYEKKGDLKPEEVKMVQVQLSPQSLQQFKRYQLEQGVRESQGMAVPRYITVTCTRQEFNGNRFGRMEFSIA